MTIQLRLIGKQNYISKIQIQYIPYAADLNRTRTVSPTLIARRGGQRAQRYHCAMQEVYEKSIAEMHEPSILHFYRYGDERTAPDDVQLAMKTEAVPLVDRSVVCVCKQRSATLDRLELNSSSWP